MRSERIRAFLGVWMPLIIGFLIIATATNFYFTAKLTGGLLEPVLEPWRFVCSAGVFFVGATMILSTYGRYKKARAARLDQTPVRME